MNRDHPILVVEDDVLDVKNIRRSFEKNRVSNPLLFAQDGEEALAMLRREPPHEAVPRPGLILLDLNLPRKSGIEFLREFKSIPSLREIPAVVLTTSDEPSDRRQAYEFGAAGYIVKPVTFSRFTDAIKRFDLYWSLCEVPNP
ncbi:MAG: response regulator [Phycisphaerales bacterium]